jgi:hypothetical protein
VVASHKVNIDFAKNSPSKIPVLLTADKSTPKAKDTKKLVETDSSMNSPVIPTKKPRLFRSLNDSNECQNKSPLRNLNLKNYSPKTPVNAKIECTPKKSLLKRILETATPAKSQTPRMMTTSTNSKNITLTTFTDPQQCIEQLIKTLTAKGIQCKQKE